MRLALFRPPSITPGTASMPRSALRTARLFVSLARVGFRCPQRAVAPGTFSDKHVVVGVTAAVTPDVHDTPFDRMRGPEVQANALDTILRGAPLRDVPPLLDVLAILLIGAVPALAALALRRYIAVATFVAGAVLFLAYAQIAFSAGWIVAVVVPLAGLLAAALGAAGLAAAGALRRRRTFE